MTPLSIEWNISLWRLRDAVMHTLKNMNARAVMKNMQQTISAEYTYKYWAVSRGPIYALMSKSEIENKLNFSPSNMVVTEIGLLRLNLENKRDSL